MIKEKLKYFCFFLTKCIIEQREMRLVMLVGTILKKTNSVLINYL